MSTERVVNVAQLASLAFGVILAIVTIVSFVL